MQYNTENERRFNTNSKRDFMVDFEHAEGLLKKNALHMQKSVKSKKISNDQELIQSVPTSCPQNQKGNN